MGSFAKLGLKNEIVEVLNRLHFKESNEVQDAIIPLALKGKNIVFTSRTGSGKTLAYLLGFLGKINKKLDVQMIVMVPTRELCLQVGKEIKKVCEPLGLTVGMFYGGTDLMGDHRITARKNQIIVGTPGRLIQHVNDKKIKVGEVRYLVYDESDQMFDHGFHDQCAYMKTRISKTAQIILASATITTKVGNFIEYELPQHELLKIGLEIPKNIVQEKLYCEKMEKNGVLLKLFSAKKFRRAMIFCNTKVKSYTISEYLKYHHIDAKSLTGDLDQKERENLINLFKDGKIPILVTTDVAARGLHIEKVDIVVNYDVPTKDEFYVHRIGRSGRVDKPGYSITLVCPEDVDRFNNIEFDYNLKIEAINMELKKIEKKEEEIPEINQEESDEDEEFDEE